MSEQQVQNGFGRAREQRTEIYRPQSRSIHPNATYRGLLPGSKGVLARGTQAHDRENYIHLVVIFRVLCYCITSTVGHDEAMSDSGLTQGPYFTDNAFLKAYLITLNSISVRQTQIHI